MAKGANLVCSTCAHSTGGEHLLAVFFYCPEIRTVFFMEDTPRTYSDPDVLSVNVSRLMAEYRRDRAPIIVKYAAGMCYNET